MPNAKISALPPATSVKSTDEFPINQDGTTKKVTLEQIQNSVSDKVGFPTGGIMMFSVSGVPTGWLKCDGSVLAINKYTNLYNIIGQNYKTLNTFNTLSGFQIPDLRGEFIRGWDGGRGVDGGRALGTLQAESFKSHTHTITDPGHKHSISDGTNNGTADGAYVDTTPTAPTDLWYTNTSKTGITIAAEGGTETRPRNVALLYCIKA